MASPRIFTSDSALYSRSLMHGLFLAVIGFLGSYGSSESQATQ